MLWAHTTCKDKVMQKQHKQYLFYDRIASLYRQHQCVTDHPIEVSWPYVHVMNNFSVLPAQRKCYIGVLLVLCGSSMLGHDLYHHANGFMTWLSLGSVFFPYSS